MKGGCKTWVYTVTRLHQPVGPLKASGGIAVRPVGNPGTAEGKSVHNCGWQLWGQVGCRGQGGLRTALEERAGVSCHGLGAEAVYTLPSRSLAGVHSPASHAQRESVTVTRNISGHVLG